MARWWWGGDPDRTEDCGPPESGGWRVWLTSTLRNYLPFHNTAQPHQAGGVLQMKIRLVLEREVLQFASSLDRHLLTVGGKIVYPNLSAVIGRYDNENSVDIHISRPLSWHLIS